MFKAIEYIRHRLMLMIKYHCKTSEGYDIIRHVTSYLFTGINITILYARI